MSMTAKQFEQALNEIGAKMPAQIARFLDAARIRLATTSTQEYMRDAGFTTPPFPPRRRRSGPLRILSGRLARSLTGSRSVGAGGGGTPENVNEIEMTKEGVKLRHGTRTPYAAVHEEGFIGRVQVPRHTRTIVQAFGRPLASKKTVTVAAHQRFMTIPARPFMGPSLDDNLKWMDQELAEQTEDLLLTSLD